MDHKNPRVSRQSLLTIYDQRRPKRYAAQATHLRLFIRIGASDQENSPNFLFAACIALDGEHTRIWLLAQRVAIAVKNGDTTFGGIEGGWAFLPAQGYRCRAEDSSCGRFSTYEKSSRSDFARTSRRAAPLAERAWRRRWFGRVPAAGRSKIHLADSQNIRPF